MIGALISKKMATLHELQTIYSFKDACNLFEIAAIDGYNEELVRRE